jgi:hypothetical protein
MKHARQDYNHIQDPLNKIPQDEPVFLLRGQDVLAPPILELYAFMAALAGRPELAQLTLEQAKLMQEWPKKKIPDL